MRTVSSNPRPDDADEPLILPAPSVPVARAPLPLLSALIPVAGAVVLWALTGSLLSLWFAALGPLLAAGVALDGLRAAGRDRRRARDHSAREQRRVGARIRERHGDERDVRRARHPDVAGYSAGPSEVWRVVPGRSGILVLGSGETASDLRVTGGDGSAAAVALRRSATVLVDAPVLIPATDGVAVVGPPVMAAAVARAFAAQLCLAMPPGELRLVGRTSVDGGWTVAVPHRHATTGLTLQLSDGEEALERGVDIPIVVVAPGAPTPPRCAAVLTLTSSQTARVDHAGEGTVIRTEAIGRRQAAVIADALADRAGSLSPSPDSGIIELGALLADAPSARPGTLPALVGRSGDESVVLDLVVDGPHALVTGVTGSGKSELLTTWITALCASHTTAQLALLLADFKGGRAFDSLAGLPHVTGVLTDLDDASARRAIESLRAELRHRERVLAQLGARSIDEAEGTLPRLVIVVDEFASLVGILPDLHDLFIDIAARGRALGMHLILASQRATGVFRDALSTNCPLRVSLRVTDAADSRVVIGTDDAAHLSGDFAARGMAFVRRAADSAPRPVRIAHCASQTSEAVAAAASTGSVPRRPWLPALPERVPLDDIRIEGALVVGLADEPEHQRQRVLALAGTDRGLLVVGRARSGKTGVLAVAAAQHDPRRTIRLGRDREATWDAVAALEEPAGGTLVLIDDADTLTSGLPAEYAAVLLDRLESAARDAGHRGLRIVATAQRLTGAAARLGPLLDRRLVLATAFRAEHVGAGGDSAQYRPDLPPGRGHLDTVAIQVAVAPSSAAPRRAAPEPTLFRPSGPTGFVAPPTASTRAVLRDWEASGIPVLPLQDAAAVAPLGTDNPTVVWGEPEAWVREWRVLSGLRQRGALLIDASCASDVRVLTGSRELPPYAMPGMGRAWLWDAGEPARRVRLDVAARESRRARRGDA